MRVAQKFAGYSLAEADNLRKACGKKNRELIAEGAREVRRRLRGHRLRRASSAPQLFDIIEPFADYAFNKSHAYGYGFIAYQTAYLKANYPVEYLAALLTSVKANLDKAAVYLAECRAMGIEVAGARRQPRRCPTSRRSPATATARAATDRRSGCPRCATWARASSALIVAEREANGPFVDFYDFCERVDLDGAQQADHRVADQGRRLRLRSATPARACCSCSSRSSTSTVARRRERDMGSCRPVRRGRATPAPSRSTSGPPIPDVEFDKTAAARRSRRRCSASTSATTR